MQFAGRNGATICYESERVIQSQYICGGIGNGATGYPATEQPGIDLPIINLPILDGWMNRNSTHSSHFETHVATQNIAS